MRDRQRSPKDVCSKEVNPTSAWALEYPLPNAGVGKFVRQLTGPSSRISVCLDEAERVVKSYEIACELPDTFIRRGGRKSLSSASMANISSLTLAGRSWIWRRTVIFRSSEGIVSEARGAKRRLLSAGSRRRPSERDASDGLPSRSSLGALNRRAKAGAGGRTRARRPRREAPMAERLSPTNGTERANGERWCRRSAPKSYDFARKISRIRAV